MPQIKDYESRVRAAGIADSRSARAEDFGSTAGQGLEVLGKGLENAATNIREHEARLELSDTTTQMSQHLAKKTQEWQETLRTADPGDKNFAQKFLDKYNQDTDQLVEGMDLRSPEAKKHFADLRAEQTKHFAVTAITGQALLIGEKAKLDRVQTLDSLQNTLRQDPAAIDVAMSQYRQSQDAFIKNGGSREALLKLEEIEVPALYSAKVVGEIKQNPDQAILDLETGKYANHLSNTQVDHLIGEAKTQKRWLEMDLQREKSQQKEALAAAQEVTSKKFVDKLYSNELKLSDLSNSNLDSAQRWQFMRAVEARANAPIHTDKEVFIDLWTRMDLPDGHPLKVVDKTPIMDAFAATKLNKEDFKFLNDQLGGGNSPEGKAIRQIRESSWKEWDNTLDHSTMNFKDDQGPGRKADARRMFRSELTRVLSEGKSQNVLFDKESKDYFGKWVRQRSLSEVVQGQVKAMKDAEASQSSGKMEPGMLEAGNIDLTNRPQVKNPDGTTSTVRSVGVNLDRNSKVEIVLPTVSDDGKNLTVPEAVALYKQTGKHLGKFKDAESAAAYADKLHKDQAKTLDMKKAGETPEEFLKRTGKGG